MSTVTTNVGSGSTSPKSPLANLDMRSPGSVAVALRQTGAMVLDSYRELSARKLFWLSVIISGIAVVVFALIGINDKGLTLLGYNLGIPYVSTAIMTPAFFYKTVFFSLGFSIWLTWAATILAIVSTAGIIPEFVASGSIDLSLSKPIGRMRLFLTKYCCALLFVGLQVAVFSFASYLVIGFRGGTWEPGLFWAVPLVLAMFSFLYCVCALIGLLTRSAIAALLLTMLFWFAIWIMHTSESILLNFRLQYTIAVQLHDTRIDAMNKKLVEVNKQLADNPSALDTPADGATDAGKGEAAKGKPKGGVVANVINGLFGSKKKKDAGEAPAAASTPAVPVVKDAAAVADADDALPARKQTATEKKLADLKTPAQLETEIAKWTNTRNDIADTRDSVIKWHRAIYAAKTFLPKTSETLGLLQRVLFSEDELSSWSDGAEERNSGRGGPGMNQRVGELQVSQFRIAKAHEEELRTRSVWWVLGTSVGFEILVLGVATFVFVRRDF